MEQFSQKTKEALGYYVYCLLDPRDRKIFYVGKGKGNRVFEHIKCAIKDSTVSDKLEQIRAIHGEGKEIKYYVIRHNLTERESLIIEASIMNLLTYQDFVFDNGADLKNIVTGHGTELEGIKTLQEIEAIHSAEKMDVNSIKHTLLVININKTYKTAESVYEATRKAWRINIKNAEKVDYIVAEYKGVSRKIFKVDDWYKSPNHIKTRWCFNGCEVVDQGILELYLNKGFLKRQGTMTPIRYFYPKV